MRSEIGTGSQIGENLAKLFLALFSSPSSVSSSSVSSSSVSYFLSFSHSLFLSLALLLVFCLYVSLPIWTIGLLFCLCLADSDEIIFIGSLLSKASVFGDFNAAVDYRTLLLFSIYYW